MDVYSKAGKPKVWGLWGAFTSATEHLTISGMLPNVARFSRCLCKRSASSSHNSRRVQVLGMEIALIGSRVMRLPSNYSALDHLPSLL